MLVLKQTSRGLCVQIQTTDFFEISLIEDHEFRIQVTKIRLGR